MPRQTILEALAKNWLKLHGVNTDDPQIEMAVKQTVDLYRARTKATDETPRPFLAFLWDNRQEILEAALTLLKLLATDAPPIVADAATDAPTD